MMLLVLAIIQDLLADRRGRDQRSEEGLQRSIIEDHLDRALPTEWQEAGVVDKLYVYPLKSGKGISVQTAKGTKVGLAAGKNRDRQFIVVDAKNRFVTARKFPKLVLVSAHIDDSDTLILQSPAMAELSAVHLPSVLGKDSQTLTIWKERGLGIDLGAEVGRWISAVLTGDPHHGLKVFWHGGGEEATRPERPENPTLLPLCKKDDVSIFADDFPFLLLSQESVDNLNRKLSDRNVPFTVDDRRFRPNIYITGVSKPHQEDGWSYVRIGEAVFRNVKLCARCVFTTVDPDKGEKDANMEPLKTLRSYRLALDPRSKTLFGSSPLFATNMAIEKMGIVSVGDKVYVAK